MCPPSVVRNTISLNSSTLFSVPLYSSEYWYLFSDHSPSEPVPMTKLWPSMAANTSFGVRPYCAITSGFIQMRSA